MTSNIVVKGKLNESQAKEQSNVYFNRRTLKESELKDTTTMKTWKRVQESYPNLTSKDEMRIRMLTIFEGSTVDTTKLVTTYMSEEPTAISGPMQTSMRPKPRPVTGGVDSASIDSAVQQALGKATTTTTSPRPMPRPAATQSIGAGSQVTRMPNGSIDGSTRGIDPADAYSPEDLARLTGQPAPRSPLAPTTSPRPMPRPTTLRQSANNNIRKEAAAIFNKIKVAANEGYKVLPPMDKERYTEIPGLEGPFTTLSGKVVYYDPKEGAYYDRDTDMYLSNDEYTALNSDYSGMQDERDIKVREAKKAKPGLALAGKKTYGIGGKARVNATEEAEQIDEISKDLKKSYLAKAKDDVADRKKTISQANKMKNASSRNFHSHSLWMDVAYKNQDKNDSRKAMMAKAKDSMKVKKDEVELDEAKAKPGHNARVMANNLDKVFKAKPDFLDMDKDGDKKEPMKKAVADKKKVNEFTNFRMTEATDPTAIMGQIRKMAKGVESSPDERQHRIFAQSVEQELIDLFQHFQNAMDTRTAETIRGLVRQNKKAQQVTDTRNANNISEVLYGLMRNQGGNVAEAKKKVVEADSSDNDLKVWEVYILNNYYNGKYADYGARPYPVLAASAEEAKQVVLDNADAILKDLLSKKLQNGKRVLPPNSAIAVSDKEIGRIEDGTVKGRRSTMGGYSTYFSPNGPLTVKLKDGNVVEIQGQQTSNAAVKEAGGIGGGMSGTKFSKAADYAPAVGAGVRGAVDNITLGTGKYARAAADYGIKNLGSIAGMSDPTTWDTEINQEREKDIAAQTNFPRAWDIGDKAATVAQVASGIGAAKVLARTAARAAANNAAARAAAKVAAKNADDNLRYQARGMSDSELANAISTSKNPAAMRELQRRQDLLNLPDLPVANDFNLGMRNALNLTPQMRVPTTPLNLTPQMRVPTTPLKLTPNQMIPRSSKIVPFPKKP
jgi:hypothetical protein